MNYDKDNLRKFAITMAIAFLLISFLLFLRHRPGCFSAAFLALLFAFLGLFYPAHLNFAYRLWMRLAFILSWVNTRIILITMFYLIFTPIAVILKLMRKDLLDRRIERERLSYWSKKGPRVFNARDYERQF
ncbi:MAG TPA: SxtJ family membrane protein [Candidatus Margulisiibacteriota bacterium]|nr:SxtJ family membrane protein [Candidatus Margulisiibacteriota bacterium]